ncbi:DUF4031 domain-containing protein [Leucobacter sp. CSA2]|uniref:DUF4031 domain-containing protein n=1 Tax=Leucobacter edaphi TaxID=2796472 RepID=A0A934QEA5_9MICO|nr:DUF4031 domain-containing protein [Leucobacter edaphi]
MTILIDPPTWPAHGTVWSHLVSDHDYEELHAFARVLGLPRRGFDLDHYDVPARLHDRAVELGARPVSGKDVLAALQAAGLRVRQVDRVTVTGPRRREYLAGEWEVLGRRLGIGSAAGPAGAGAAGRGSGSGSGSDSHPMDRWTGFGAGLLARWNEPHRGYHDERHLEDVLLSLDQISVRGEFVAEDTLLAAWFHDAVYAGAAGVDEADSARLAVSSLAELGVAPGLAQRVGEHILATEPGRDAAAASPALAQLLDADLAIFAAPVSRYEQYAHDVRREYSHVPDREFARGRSAILAAYLDRDTIYLTPTGRKLWEARARANVTAELARLRG